MEPKESWHHENAEDLEGIPEKVPWTLEDDVQLMVEIGRQVGRNKKNWRRASKKLPGRSTNALRLRYRFLLKQLWRKAENTSLSEFELICGFIKENKEKLEQTKASLQVLPLASKHGGKISLRDQKLDVLRKEQDVGATSSHQDDERAPQRMERELRDIEESISGHLGEVSKLMGQGKLAEQAIERANWILSLLERPSSV